MILGIRACKLSRCSCTTQGSRYIPIFVVGKLYSYRKELPQATILVSNFFTLLAFSAAYAT
jgi:hypothetical protein